MKNSMFRDQLVNLTYAMQPGADIQVSEDIGRSKAQTREEEKYYLGAAIKKGL